MYKSVRRLSDCPELGRNKYSSTKMTVLPVLIITEEFLTIRIKWENKYVWMQ